MFGIKNGRLVFRFIKRFFLNRKDLKVLVVTPIESQSVRGAVASWLVCSTPDRVVRVRGLAGDIVLCSWARHFTLTVPLSTQVYKWVPA